MFHPPFQIYIDFFAITKSDTRENLCLLHPSVATCVNATTLITSSKDQQLLLSEFSAGNLHEKVLRKHHLTRTIQSEQTLVTSNVRINKLVCLWSYINPLQ